MVTRRLGGQVLAAAAAFAVALAVLVSSPTTAEAATVTLAAAANSGSAAPGDTVRIVVNSPFANVSITGTADGVGASFASGGGQSVSCANATSCDKDTSANVAVDLKVDADSGEGHILLSVRGLGATVTTKVITVSKETLVGSLTISASSKTIAATGGTSTLVINVKSAEGTPTGMNDQAVSVVTTLGSIQCTASTETQACTETTAGSQNISGVANDTPGYGTVTLRGKGVEGQAVVTARLGTLTATATVTLFGTAKNLTAEPRQNSIEIGGEVYVVLTVTDGAGHPVSGQVITPVTSKEVVGPSGVDKPVLVKTEKDTPALANTRHAAGVGYSKDYIDAKNSKNNIPACGDDNTGATEQDEAFGTNGTNADGKCVVHVTAPKAAGTQKAATRGVHTLNFQVSASVKASAEIEVAGSPAIITTNAPEAVDPGSVTEITVSVWDDIEVLVGITDVKVRQVDGGGLVEDAGENGSEKTVNGRSKFTFIAPSAPGTAEILITAGTVNQRLDLSIGDTAPPVSVSAQSGLVIVQNAGSIEDLLGALACGGDEGTTVRLPGNNTYIVGAPAFMNAAFMSNVRFPIESAAAYVSCG